MVKPVATEQGIPIGNHYDKYESENPIASFLMSRFLGDLFDLIDITKAVDVHEAGCGEGRLCGMIANLDGVEVRGSDFSGAMISVAREQNQESGITFAQSSIYDLTEDDGAELMLCCEVLEHLDRPEEALETLSRLADPYCILSVPREPIWRILNVSRGKYISDCGNTPGHIQHWSKTSFIRLCSKYFDVVDARSPLPWTQVLCRTRSKSR